MLATSKKHKSSLSSTAAKARRTLVNFLIHDTEKVGVGRCFFALLSVSVSLSVSLSVSVSLVVVAVETIKTEADQEVCDKEKPGSRLTHNLSFGFSKLAPSRPAINRVGLTFHH